MKKAKPQSHIDQHPIVGMLRKLARLNDTWANYAESVGEGTIEFEDDVIPQRVAKAFHGCRKALLDALTAAIGQEGSPGRSRKRN